MSPYKELTSHMSAIIKRGLIMVQKPSDNQQPILSEICWPSVQIQLKFRSGTDVLNVCKSISAVLSPPVNTGSIPELAARFEERTACHTNGINRMCATLLPLLFQVGQ